MKRPGFLNGLIYILTGLAILNLILLFGFQYEVPNIIKEKLFHQNTRTDGLYKEKGEEEPQPALSFVFEYDTLSYDGSSALDLLADVTLQDSKGNTPDIDIYSSIESTDDPNRKLITYSARDEEGNEATAQRTLHLQNYEGPTLTIEQPYPEIIDVELNHILEAFQGQDLLYASDGYGKDITSSIQWEYKVADTKATVVDITFHITNHFDDTVSKTISAPIFRTKPIIILTQSSVTIQKGTTIDPLSYVESASNEEGEDLIPIIKIEGDVNTAEAGEYTITYTLTDSDREQADPVKLKVIVEE